MFNHKFLEKEELPSTTNEDGRIYHSPVGDLRSVTTILGDNQDKEWLKEWQKAVGKEESDRESKMATRHGSTIHNLIESYLMNAYSTPLMPTHKITMKKVMPLLDAHIHHILGIEFPLWSEKLRTAGRVDLISDWDHVLAIVDFKTSKNQLSMEEVIERGYFLQTTAYSLMLEERLGLRAQKNVIINIPEFEDPTFFIQYRGKYIPEVIRIFTGEKND